MSDDWEWWHDESDHLTVIPTQAAVAVYRSAAGNIVIRQDGHQYEREDELIVFAPEHARRVAGAILALAEPESAPLALPAPMTPAERAKRYRDNKRHSERDARRDGNTSELFAKEVLAAE